MKFSTQLLVTTLSKTTENISVFVLSIILARYFTKAEYGTYLHVQLIVNVCIWSFLLGIPHSIYYFLPKVANQKKYLINIIKLIMAIGFLVSFVAFLCIPYISDFLVNKDINGLGLIVALLILFQIPTTIFEPLMISAGEVKKFASIKSFFSFSFFLSIVIPVSFSADLKTILTSLVSMFLLHTLIVFYYSILIAFKLKGGNELGRDCSFKEQSLYSLPIGLSTGIGEMSSYVDKIIVSNQSSPEDYAVYTRGAMNLPIISIIANTLDNLLMPRFVKAFQEDNTEEVINSWHTTIRLMAAFIYPCCFFLIVSAPLLIPALFSERYIDSVIIFQVYTLGLLTRISTFSVIVRAIGKTKVILWVTMGTVISNIVFTLLFMQWWGLVGAPIATVMTMLISRLLYVYAITYYLKLSMIAVFPWKSLSHSFIVSALSVLPVVFFLNYSLNIWLQLLLSALLFSCFYVFLTRFSMSLTYEDKKVIKGMAPKGFKWIV